MKTAGHRRSRGFTLVEIAITVLVVGVLSAIAVATIKHVQERAARSTISNNLRQLYLAKEQFFFESGGVGMTTTVALAREGYLRESVRQRLTTGATFEAHMGWHYGAVVMPGQPTYAYKGQNPGRPVASNSVVQGMTWTQTTGDVIWYPAPPTELANAVSSSAAASSSATAPGAGSGSASTASAQPAEPAAQSSPPPGAPILKNGQIARYGISTQRELYFDDARWSQVLGVSSPDGSPVTVVAIRSDPPDFIGTATRHGSYFPVPISRPGVQSTATLYVTFKNGSGEATLPMTLNILQR